jgi:hypothetical protein
MTEKLYVVESSLGTFRSRIFLFTIPLQLGGILGEVAADVFFSSTTYLRPWLGVVSTAAIANHFFYIEIRSDYNFE